MPRSSSPAARRGIVTVLASAASMRSLLVALLGLRLAEDAAWLTLLLYAYQKGGVGEAGWVAVALLAPAVVLAPAVAAVVDAASSRRILPIGFALMAASLGATAGAVLLDAPSLVVYGCGLVFSVLLTFPAPAAASVVPRMARSPDQLTAANVGVGMMMSLAELLGPAVAGVLLYFVDLGAALAAMAGLMTLGALLGLRAVPGDLAPRAHVDDPPINAIGERLMAGLHLIRRDRPTLLIVFVLATTSIAAGALDVGAAAVAVEFLGRTQDTATILVTSLGAGTLLGVVVSIGLVGRRRLTLAIAGSSIVAAGAFAALSQVRSLVPAVVLLVLVGAGTSVSSIAGRTMLQSLTPDDTLARVFGVLESTSTAALALGGAAFSLAVVHLGLGSGLLLLGALGAVVPVLLWPALRAIDADRAPVDLELLALLRSTVIFAPLPPFALEQLLRNFVREEATPDQVVLRRGDPGDDMMVIGRGHLVVHLPDGGTIERGVGSYVGELALLTSGTRNADVVAGPDGATLYRLDRTVFLDAVDRAPRSRARVTAEADRRSISGQNSKFLGIENAKDRRIR
ncbi:MAG: cyclic nucleotide-binding domain-containing protein [Acidimicrobiales bacterium]